MSRLEHALRLAERGFYVFPVAPDGKLPAIKDWVNKATREPEQISKWWSNRDYNIGISTTRFGDDKALCVVDVDTKDGKDGERSLLQLELQGQELPVTLEQATPSGGRHLVYLVDAPLRQGVDVLGNGLDIRSRGGFILGPGSEIGGRKYAQINGHGVLASAPGWLVDRLGHAPERRPAVTDPLAGVDASRAQARARDWLMTHAPLARQGDGGDITTYKVAAQLKDFGLTEEDAFGLMLDTWNEANEPPWSADELADKVAHAFRYGKDQPGIAAPEAVFAAAEPPAPAEGDEQHPLDKVNGEYAFILAGGSGAILWETTDQQGQFTFHLLNKETFKDKLAAKKLQVGDKVRPLAQAWMEWDGRRSFDGMTFLPGKDAGSRWYNMWRGFTVQPAADAAHPMVARWCEHLLQNVCNGDAKLADWLTSWFAQLIQRPWEKPLVAVCFRGSKGTGKNALVERVGKLLGSHSIVTSRRRYLVSNFTMHLQKCLMFVLDEAFWSGDKEAEGVVKDLITGDRHLIEPKGKETYEVKNLTRVVVIGNEKWLVPATEDERRWAVFDIGEGRKQDRRYFEEMRVGLDDQGGNAHLLRYLLDYKISQDVNQAPKTSALTDQKHASLEPVEQWWFDCLSQGEIGGGDFGAQWPELVPTNRMRDAFERWARRRNIRSRLPADNVFGATLKKVAPSMVSKKIRPDTPGDATRGYVVPALKAARKDWEKFIDGLVDWENDE
ncbi:bifunctional DNA primase/polymerase [Ensifer adhaerens]|uniref:bifunctional DNA primase/polymerase n=1 Tax=Ensifer adhaerens TaxID=106592 RepID=UPI000CF0FEE6|nr:bifunctional DNA primase/polymerase [Ensifer adhaerens]